MKWFEDFKNKFFKEKETIPKLKTKEYIESLLDNHANKVVEETNQQNIPVDSKNISMIPTLFADTYKAEETTQIENKENVGEVKNMVEAFCMKEKTKRNMIDGKEEKNARGLPVMKGKCEKCGTSMYKILPSKK